MSVCAHACGGVDIRGYAHGHFEQCLSNGRKTQWVKMLNSPFLQDTKFSNKRNTFLIRKKRPEIPEITLHPDNVNRLIDYSIMLTMTEKMF